MSLPGGQDGARPEGEHRRAPRAAVDVAFLRSGVDDPHGAGQRRSRARQPRRASLALWRVGPLAALKTAVVLSLALFLVWMAVVGAVYGALDALGVWRKLNGSIHAVAGANGPVVTATPVFAIAALVGAVGVVAFIVVTIVASLVYNAAADSVGGLQATLAERW